MAVPIEEIEAALKRVRPYVHETPVMTCQSIDAMVGQDKRILFKCEHLQRVGAFKIRGAVNAVAKLGNASAVVTHSSGNHAQALALAGRMKGIPAHIIMPSNAPTVKRNAVEQTYGATVYPCTPTIAARQIEADKVIKATGGVFIHPYNNRDVQAGQGTAGYEFVRQAEDMGLPMDAVVIAVGGGGMFTGMASAIKAYNPNIKVYAAEPEGANDTARGIKEGRIMEEHLPGQPDTIADGLLTLLAPSTFAGVKALADGVITVSDKEIAAAMRLILERMKQLIEPSAAVPLAALLSGRFPVDPKVKNIGVVLCGGNLDLASLTKILQLSDEHSARL